MTALFQRTGAGDFPRYIKMLVQGPPKSGKTSFLATAPNVVIADLEYEANGLMSIAHKNIPYVQVDSTDKLVQLRFVLGDQTLRAKAAEQMGMPQIETVAIDTMDTLQKLLKKERLRSEKRTMFTRDDWSWLLEQMREIINGFNGLPLNVIYTVHTTTKQDSDEKMVTMPGLQGAIAEEIAGMVGYSVLMNRTREVRPDGTPYTKYSLKVEGDDKNPHLGNRAAGRLPEIIEPDFQKLQDAVFAGLSLPVSAPAVELVQPSIQIQEVAQSVGQSEAAPAAPAGPPSDGDQPVNATALQHLQKLFSEVGLEWDEERIKQRTMDEARQVVTMWNAIKQDFAEGKGQGPSAQAQMVEFLGALGWLPPEGGSEVGTTPTPAAPTAPAAVEPKIDGTIEQVLAYVGDDLTKVQEAYDLEHKRDKPRATLVNALVNKGAKTVGTVQTPVENLTPETVTSDASVADTSSTEEAAVELVKEVLGGTVIEEEQPESPAVDAGPEPCEECGKPVDDPDIALLSRSRYDRWLCVDDYVIENKKSRDSVA